MGEDGGGGGGAWEGGRRKGGWIKAEQLPTPLECERVVTSLSISIFSHHCPGALPASASVCVCVRLCVSGRMCTHSSRGREPNTTGRRFPVSVLRLRWLSVTQTRIIALIVKSARGVSERTALCCEGLERGKTTRSRRRGRRRGGENPGDRRLRSDSKARGWEPLGGAREAIQYWREEKKKNLILCK